MKLSRMFKKLSVKKLAASATVALAVLFPAASLAAQTVHMEGSLGVANVTAGDTTYKPSVNATYDQVVKLQVYYHNTENPDSGKIAENVTVKINIPTGAGKVQNVTSRISSDNSNTVTSTATVNLDKTNAYLQYIPGSAVWKHNTGTNDNPTYVETKISDAVVTSGQGLRIENEKPCFNFAATVTVLARVIVPAVEIKKEVQKANETGKYAHSNTAAPGDTLKYKISYKNNGNSRQEDVVIRDSLPNKMSLVPDSTYLYNATNPNGVLYNSNNITRGGIVIGDYGPGAIAYIVFQVKVPAADQLNCGSITFTNVGVAQPKGGNEYYDQAVTTVTKTCANVPTAKCDALELAKLGGRKVSLGVKYTVTNGATLKNVTYDFGDGTAPLLTGQTSGVEHTYAKDGEYTMRATLRFTVNGAEQSSVCENKVAFTSGVPTPPTTPTTLVNTGAGDVLGMFAAVTVAGAIAHRIVLARRLS